MHESVHIGEMITNNTEHKQPEVNTSKTRIQVVKHNYNV